MDEPLSNLDAKLRDDMRVEIRRIQRQVGITTIFVTHDQAEAFALADRIGVMTQGRLRQMANPALIYEAPANATVGNFIGQVNTLTGRVSAFEGERARIEVNAGLEITGVGRDLQLGVVVTSIVKQERVLLSRRQPAAGENVFPCRIETMTYLGGHINYVCRLQSEVMNAIVPNHPSFETVFAWWSSADCHVFGA
jgi:ABC-type Fe3+/spermidine/putrescine transport system ATPase subunit